MECLTYRKLSKLTHHPFFLCKCSYHLVQKLSWAQLPHPLDPKLVGKYKLCVFYLDIIQVFYTLFFRHRLVHKSLLLCLSVLLLHFLHFMKSLFHQYLLLWRTAASLEPQKASPILTRYYSTFSCLSTLLQDFCSLSRCWTCDSLYS